MKHIITLVTLIFTCFAFGSPPVIVTGSTVAHTPLCAGQSSTFYSIAVSDAEFDAVSVTSIVSDNFSVISSANITWSVTNVVGNTTYIELYGTPLTTGNVQFTVQVSDGSNNASATLPAVTIIDGVPPVFTMTPITVCSDVSMVNLNEYVSEPGGSWTSWDIETVFPGGIVDFGNIWLDPDDTIDLQYNVSVGNCYYNVTGSLAYPEAPSFSYETEEATCNQDDGDAYLYTSGQFSDYSVLWSNGYTDSTELHTLAAGLYSVTLTAANGCMATESFSIPTASMYPETDIVPVDCFGASTGGASVVPAGMEAPVSALWSSGHSSLTVSGLPAGDYTVTLTDANGCVSVAEVDIWQNDQIYNELYSNPPSCGSEDGSIEVETTSGGSGDYTYQWSNGAQGGFVEDLGLGIYSLTTTDDLGCQQINTVYLSELNGPDIYGNVTPADCGDDNGAIDVTAYPFFGTTLTGVSWSNNASTIDISDLIPANYVCTLEGSNGCRSVKGWDLPTVKPMQNNICVLTVDDETTTNLVVWEKAQTVGIAYYNIYRETSVPNNFVLIDTVHADGESVFNDVVASPVQRSWRYKISAVNTCGEEGLLSLPHQTIHLQVVENSSGGVSVNWNAYQGTSFDNYYLARYTDQNGWQDIAMLSNTTLSYQDNVPLTTPGLDYVVEMQLSTPCTADKIQDFNSSRSNKDRAQFNPGEGTGDSHNDLEENYLSSVTVHPNPAASEITITQLSIEKLEVKIMSVEGQLVHQSVVGQLTGTVDVSALAAGIYFVNLQAGSAGRTVRIVKQ